MSTVCWRGEVEAEKIPAAQAYGMGLLPYFPLASGMLTGKYKRGARRAAGTRFASIPRLADRYSTDAQLGAGGTARSVLRQAGADACWNWRSVGCWRGLRWLA